MISAIHHYGKRYQNAVLSAVMHGLNARLITAFRNL